MRARVLPLVLATLVRFAISQADAVGSAAVAARVAAQPELAKAWQQVPDAQRAGLAFLIEQMPDADAASLSAEFLLRETRLAYAARAAMPWGAQLPDAVFFGHVLPYAQANEAREDWRVDFAARFQPMVADCKGPGAAAQRLNERIFDLLSVHYSTARRRADQAPSESIAQGKASCTGLAILLADACRACCVPARLVSVRWPHRDGNHTWVEVWDAGGWHFLGADEPDPHGLDRGWFVADAAHCAAADAAHRVYAVSFARTDRVFAAGWAPGVELSGEDVSARYAAAQDPQQQGGAGAGADDAVLQQLGRFFAADAETQAKFEFDRNLDAELRSEAGDARLRALAWRAFKAAPHEALRADFAASRVSTDDRTSAYKVQQVGEPAPGGFGLVIAMHGGGGVPTLENDQQWEVMQRYYRPHPEQGGYLYCALRAPNDAWNGFYDDAFYPLFERLVRQFVVCGNVDPDRVTAIGYSHGGYGAFAVGPKLPYRFAAVHASAAAPTDGESSPVGLHSLAFSFMVGGRDTAHGRRERCEAFGAALATLRGAHPGRYGTTFTLVENNGHTGLPDRDILPWLLARTRTATPRELHWEPTDGVVRDHYWLHLPAPQKGQRVDARVRDQSLDLTLRGVAGIEVWLDARLCDLQMDLALTVGEHGQTVHLEPSLRTLCRTLQQRGDPALAASVVLTLP